MEPELMGDTLVMEAEHGSERSTGRKRKLDTEADGSNDGRRAAAMKKITLALTKPSFVLGIGPKMLRAENRTTLRNVLRKLMMQQNWVEASGVLSMLLKGTLRDRSPIRNRLKYSVSMELLKHIEGDRMRPNRIKHIYDNWMRKIGSMKRWPVEDRFMVHVEFILFCLEEGSTEDAHQAALCLMQEHESVNDPMSNMIIGLTFRQLWFSTLPEEIQWRDSLQYHSPIRSDRMILNSDGCSVSNSRGDGASYQSHSETSVMDHKLIHVDSEGHTEASFEDDHKIKVENHPQKFEPLDFYVSSVEKDENEASFSDNGGYQHCVSIFSALEGLDPLLLPLHLPPSVENWENALSLCGEFLNDYYKDAVKHLELALNSNPPILVALLPFIQLLLIGGRVDKALDEMENICCDSNATLPFRLKAALVEHFDHSNVVLLSTCYEKILKKDPTCCHSLGKLVLMHRNGNYSLESLLEMIALHLDGTRAEYDTWRELAMCFLKLSQIEEDRVSAACSIGSGGHKLRSSLNINCNLKLFTEKNLRNAWRLRCRWWLTHHFCCNITSETSDGTLELLTYKAACACHMYGSNHKYVVEVYSLLDKQNDKHLLLFLKKHMNNSFQLHSKLCSQ
ncbi:uncharacterized protein LOC111479331 [Cucurbita maxima]|uniref:Uncharacterized protein LOC111479331 n=1 Tax=Cucurbita maxima TaxID=3661 RepID=A0A6J1IWZ8_CUCMA|nr:uncharacterized protein LOC111479331 [Cucurbita maxima]